jgi:Uma2 family endonuclease
LRIRHQPISSTTLKRRDLQKGVDPDSAYYFAHATCLDPREIDAERDPPPDLVIEVDFRERWLGRSAILAGLGVPEIWRHDGSRLNMYVLEKGRYVEAVFSRAIPPLGPETATRFIDDRRRLDMPDWTLLVVLDWVRQQC